MKIVVFLMLTFLFSVTTNAQSTSGEYFLVEFEKFSPPVRDMVTSFEGSKAERFLAKDINGNEHFLGSYQGKKVILWFWSTYNPMAQQQMSAMTLLQERNKDLVIIAMVKEPKAEVLEYVRTYPTDLPVIPNGEVFGQMAYGAELGSPRMFLIDAQGIIKVVLPEEAFVNNERLLVSLESMLGGF